MPLVTGGMTGGRKAWRRVVLSTPISSRQNVMVDYKMEKDMEKAIKIYKTGGPEVMLFKDLIRVLPAPDKR